MAGELDLSAAGLGEWSLLAGAWDCLLLETQGAPGHRLRVSDLVSTSALVLLRSADRRTG